jgi:creatinine amidohydrolase
MARELEDAKSRRVPLVIPVGTIEYHGPHCALGCDTQIAAGLLDRLSQERELVIAPPIWYGVASYAVAGPDKNTVQVDVDVFEQYVHAILKSLLTGGWKNIYLLIHHQYEQENLLPMTLACMKAAKKLVFAYLEETRGQGWWGDNANAAFYAQLEQSDSPWQWITVLPCMSTAAQNATGYDHAGKWECSILSALCPEAVSLDRVCESDAWFIQDAVAATPEIGEQMIEWSLASLRERIK